MDKTNTLADLRKLPKGDLHNHCLLGGRRPILERHYGKKLKPLKVIEPGLSSLNNWVINEYRPFLMIPGSFEKGVEAAFVQAVSDGVTRLEMSIDVLFARNFNITPEHIVETLTSCHQKFAPGIVFIPELGLPRTRSLQSLRAGFESFLTFDYFKSIDLYDDEQAAPASNFIEIYRFAKSLGMKCKAHAGEFGSADSVQEAVEVLELDAVQHGIGAADSPSVMKWLAKHQVPLNVCPASNIRLKRVRSYKTHPLRTLMDHGVKVTINTDDVLLFGNGVSEQYVKLFRTGMFTREELETIRQNSLEQ